MTISTSPFVLDAKVVVLDRVARCWGRGNLVSNARETVALTHHARLDPSANDGRRRSVPFRHQGEPDAAPALGRGAFLGAPRVSSGLPRPRRRVQLQQN